MNKSQKAVVQNYCTKLKDFIKAGYALRKGMKALVPVFNKASAVEQLAIRSEVAKLIAELKGIKPKLMEKGAYKGSLGFDAHGTDEENQARVMMQTYLPCKKKKASSVQPVAKQVDEAEELLKRLYAMSKKVQDRFDYLYEQDKKAKRRAK